MPFGANRYCYAMMIHYRVTTICGPITTTATRFCMPRQPRYPLPGLPQPVIQRGNNRPPKRPPERGVFALGNLGGRETWERRVTI